VDAESASFHICGPGPFVAALRKELAPLKLSRARLRSSFSGDTVYLRRPGGTSAHRLTVRIGGEVRCVPAREDETILTALERAGLQPEASCRSSICGLCSATILSGSYILATDEAGERKMDVRHGLIHPCCSYPVSDMEIIVPRVRNQPTLSKKEWCEVLLEAAQDVGGVEPELPERHSPRAGLV
jgi:ferredoxin